jgi:hemerythrin
MNNNINDDDGNFEVLKWSPTFSVGVQVIDEQHKGLLDLVNDMFNHVSGNDQEEREYFQKVIQQAVQYVKVHFTTEEKIMISTFFPGYAEHKKAHDSFILAVVENAKNFESDKKLTLHEFTYFLKEWVLTHIAIMDKQYFTYFKQIATRKANGRLSINRLDVERNQ